VQDNSLCHISVSVFDEKRHIAVGIIRFNLHKSKVEAIL